MGLVLKVNVAYVLPQEGIDSIIPFIEKENSNIIIFRSRRGFSVLYFSNIKYKSKKEHKKKVQWVDTTHLLLHAYLKLK